MSSTQILRTLRVLELGEYISAAYCTRVLGDYGAEVIKVEPPRIGDLARRHGPFPNDDPDPERSGLYIFLNTGKRSVTLDVTCPMGAEIVLELVRQSDVVVHNYRPQVLKRLGFTYDRLRQINPTIVLTSITPFGQEGPHSEWKAYPLNTSAAAGSAHRIGLLERYPIAMPYARSDYWGGMNGASATMIALLTWRRDGRGQHADIAITEAINTFGNGVDTISFADAGATTVRSGIRTPISYPYTVLPCKDGHFAMIIGSDTHWERWLELMGSPEWSKDPRYHDRRAMGFEYPEEVDALVKPFLAQHTKRELWAMCRQANIPWHAVQTIDEVLDWEQLEYRGYWQPVTDSASAQWKTPGSPFRLTGTPAQKASPAPRLGEHNQEILGRLLGLPNGELAALQHTGVI